MLNDMPCSRLVHRHAMLSKSWQSLLWWWRAPPACAGGKQEGLPSLQTAADSGPAAAGETRQFTLWCVPTLSQVGFCACSAVQKRLQGCLPHVAAASFD